MKARVCEKCKGLMTPESYAETLVNSVPQGKLVKYRCQSCNKIIQLRDSDALVIATFFALLAVAFLIFAGISYLSEYVSSGKFKPEILIIGGILLIHPIQVFLDHRRRRINPEI